MKLAIFSSLITLVTLAGSLQAQSTYEPYYFSLYAGMPGVLGAMDGIGSNATLNSPQGIATDGAGNVYIADTGNNTVRKILPDKTVTTLAGSPGMSGSTNGQGSVARFNLLQGVAAEAGGTVYVADTLNNTIRKISPTGLVTTFAGAPDTYGSADGTGATARFNYPIGLAVDGSSNVYVADSGNNTIRKITSAGVVTTLAGSAGHPGFADGSGPIAQFCSPRGVAVDSSGVVYVADACNATIRRISPAGQVTTLAGLAGSQGSADGNANAARFSDARGIAVDGVGNLYVADTGNSTVRRLSPSGTVTTLGGVAGVPGSADGVGNASKFNFPQGIAASGAGRIYLSDTNNHLVRVAGPGPAPLSLRISDVMNSLSQLTGEAPPNASILISSAPDLIASFSPVATVVTDSNGNFWYHDSSSFMKRFYKASFSSAP
ncbi:MAG: NHL repeat-containing protein [Chthoniobacterales bacterium]